MKYQKYITESNGTFIMDTESGSWIAITDEKNKAYKNYLAWVAEGNIAEYYVEPPIPQSELDKIARKTAAKAHKGKINITKEEQAELNDALIDLLGE